MKKLTLALALICAALPVQAEIVKIYVSQQGADPFADLPRQGDTMEQVRARFGTPADTRDAVGQPPISVWRYDQFTVYFERATVIRTVQHHQPAE